MLPTLSVARATRVYDPSAGWLLQLTVYGAVVSGVPMTVPAQSCSWLPAQYAELDLGHPGEGIAGRRGDRLPVLDRGPSGGSAQREGRRPSAVGGDGEAAGWPSSLPRWWR